MGGSISGPYVLVHDIGTTGDKAALFDISSGTIVASVMESYETIYPQTLWAEQDPLDWWRAFKISTQKLLKTTRINLKDIVAVSFSGQMMACLPISKKGEPLSKAIIWMDQRSIKEIEYIKNRIPENEFYRITGNRLSPTYPIAKILWLKNNRPQIYEHTHMFLQSKDYIVMKLTNTFQTDYSDASLSGMMDIVKREWATDLLDVLGIDTNKLPSIKSSLYIVGEVTFEASRETMIPYGIPVVLGGGDGACATLGARAVEPGDTYNYIGSSSWIAVVSDKPAFDPKMRIFNLAHIDPRYYSPAGTMQTAGASLKWFKDNVFLMERISAEYVGLSPYELIDREASRSSPGSNGLIYLPYLMGERSPWWNPYARGVIIGLTLRHTRNDIARSILEGIGYNLKIILDVLKENTRGINEPIVLIGGGARSKLWPVILSSIYNASTALVKYPEESTALGAAIAAATATKHYKDLTEIRHINELVEIKRPEPDAVKTYEKMYRIFIKSYQSLIDIFTDLAKVFE
ncbi:MAG: xylulokinase [Staphylothermus sp.]|nr:xylulokinase [Staphylothermus sp.]